MRGHWEIEKVHWMLDVSFREDTSRVRKNHAPANLSIIRRMALILICQDPAKDRLQDKRRKGG